ncbi:MAG: uroporphyrinogen-III synthase [bacterium]|nr:uroporphyrinogen-III synthase [bacterium]
MRYLITRPRQDAIDMASLLEDLGHHAIISPVMQVNCLRPTLPHAAFLHGLVITSRNALRCLEKIADLQEYHHLPFFAVGDNSAQQARDFGFTKINQGAGRARDLVPVIKEVFVGTQRPKIYHPTGIKKAFDLAPPLAQTGIRLVEQIIYETSPANNLAHDAIDAITSNKLDGVVLMSPQSAKYFHALVRQNQLEDEMSKISFLCLSTNVADALEQMPSKRKLIAREANLQGILDLIAL